MAGVERTKKRADEVSQGPCGGCGVASSRVEEGAQIRMEPEDQTASKRRLGPGQVSHVSGRRLARSDRALGTGADGRGGVGAKATDGGMQRGRGGGGGGRSGSGGSGSGSSGVVAVVVLTGAACRVGGVVGPDMGGSAAEEKGKCGRSAREQAGRRGMRVQ